MTESEARGGKFLRDIFYQNVSALRDDFDILDKKAYFWLRLIFAVALALTLFSFTRNDGFGAVYLFIFLAIAPLAFLAALKLLIVTRTVATYTGVFMPDTQSELSDWLEISKQKLGLEELWKEQMKSAWNAANDMSEHIDSKSRYLKRAEGLIALIVPVALIVGHSFTYLVMSFDFWWGCAVVAISFVVGIGINFAAGIARFGRRFWNRFLGYPQSL